MILALVTTFFIFLFVFILVSPPTVTPKYTYDENDVVIPSDGDVYTPQDYTEDERREAEEVGVIL